MKQFLISIAIILSVLPLKASEQFIYTTVSNRDGLTSAINCIYKEKDGDVLLGTMSGLYAFNGHEVRHFDDSLLCDRIVYQIEEDKEGNIWALTDRWVMFRKKGEEDFIRLTAESRYQAPPFYSICQDEDGVWLGSQGSIYRYTYEDRRFSHFRDLDGKDFFFCTFMNKLDRTTLLCSSNSGSILLDTETGDFRDAPSGPLKEVSGTMTDSKGRLWMAYYNNGIRVYEKDGTLIKAYTTDNSPLSNDVVICFVEKDSKIWAGTDGGGINIIDPENDSIQVLSPISGDSSSFPGHSIKRLHTDHYGNIWAGSTRDGLIKISQSGMKTYTNCQVGHSSGLSNPTVLCLFQEEGDDAVWIGTDGGGVNRYDPKTNRFTHYLNTLDTKVITISTYSDRELAISVYADRIWLLDKRTGGVRPLEINDEYINYFMKYTGRSLIVSNGTGNSLFLLSNTVREFDKKTGTCHTIPVEEGESTAGNIFVIGRSDKGLYLHDMYNIWRVDEEAGELRKVVRTDYNIRCGYIGDNGDIWLATDKGVCLFNEYSGEVRHIATNLFSDASAVVWDGKSKVWIGADQQLFAYLTEEDSFTMFGESDGASLNEYLSKPRLLSCNGDVYIGGAQGLLRIDSEYTIDATEVPQIRLSNIFADRERIHADEEGVYEVPRDSKILSISISTQETDIFRQKLYRFLFPDSGKEYVQRSPTLEIQSIPDPGKHDILVSCTKRNGEWTEPTKIMTLRVPRPWYLSGWFMAGVAAFILLTAGSVAISLMYRKASRLRLALKEQEQQIYEDKVKMLINISHELRTPLTLIMAPLKRLLNGSISEEEQSATLSRVYRQSKRMKDLLDMVLDLRKLEVGKSGLKMEKSDFNAWISSTVEDIIKEEKAEEIEVSTDLDPSVGMVDFDRRKCETVLMNILMNAIKHSSKGDHITIKTSLMESGNVRVSICDEGPGLGDIDRSRLFTRFYQSNSEAYGSGIGLSYSKILVELQGGMIGAENNVGKGATFWWEIPAVSGSVAEIPSKAYLNELIDYETAEGVSIPETESLSTSGARLMLVDDNKDLLDFLCEALTGEFAEILTASGGSKALSAIAGGKLPDIIVSDVNMPDGDGYKLCAELKGNERYSHIPVILLTARGEGQSDGYKVGADAFIAKPFEVETLLELIRNILRKRNDIRKKYLDIDEKAVSDYGSDEESFIIRLNRIVSDHIDDPELDQQMLCREMGMSRATLFNKMKRITGSGAKEYITRLRIEKAKKLMEDTDMTIAEISDRTGFASQSYFSTAFKSQTGFTPSQYRNENNKRQHE